MLAFRMVCSEDTLYAAIAAKVARRVASVTSSQRSIVWLPSSRTSGSIIGPIDAAWQEAA